MPIVVTPGSADADAYVTIAEANTFMANVNNVEWENFTTEQQESAIRRVTTFIDATMGGRFKGRKTNGRTQSLEWPRVGVTDISGDVVESDSIPREVKRAALFGIKMELDGELDTSTSYLGDGSIEDLKVGPLSIGFAAYGSTVRGPDPTKALEPYFRGLLRVRNITGLVV